MNYSPPPPRKPPRTAEDRLTLRHWVIIAMSLAAAFAVPFLLLRLIDRLT